MIGIYEKIDRIFRKAHTTIIKRKSIFIGAEPARQRVWAGQKLFNGAQNQGLLCIENTGATAGISAGITPPRSFKIDLTRGCSELTYGRQIRHNEFCCGPGVHRSAQEPMNQAIVEIEVGT